MRGWVEGKGEQGTGGSKGQIETLVNGPRHPNDLKEFKSCWYFANASEEVARTRREQRLAKRSRMRKTH